MLTYDGGNQDIITKVRQYNQLIKENFDSKNSNSETVFSAINLLFSIVSSTKTKNIEWLNANKHQVLEERKMLLSLSKNFNIDLKSTDYDRILEVIEYLGGEVVYLEPGSLSIIKKDQENKKNTRGIMSAISASTHPLSMSSQVTREKEQQEIQFQIENERECFKLTKEIREQNRKFFQALEKGEFKKTISLLEEDLEEKSDINEDEEILIRNTLKFMKEMDVTCPEVDIEELSAEERELLLLSGFNDACR